MNPARYIMLGGFLGAGKSTAVGHLARWLTRQGLRVGLVTNDQGSGLVDTLNFRTQGFDVEEIAGGCFCCRFESLQSAAEKLTRDSRPDVFIAEPVGSCTDLIATVSYPLRRIYGDSFIIAPLSVLLDPIRAFRILGWRPGRGFSAKVRYVYEKQMEEADCLIVNKTDLLEPTESQDLADALRQRYPQKELFQISARDEKGLVPWFESLLSDARAERPTMDLNYQRYGEGEALLGWVNCTMIVNAPHGMDGNLLLESLAEAIQRSLGRTGGEVAHLKMTLMESGGLGDLALISLVRQDFVPELTQTIEEPVFQAQIVLNLRAESDPETLRKIVEDCAQSANLDQEATLVLEHMESFSPQMPRPTHRITVAST